MGKYARAYRLRKEDQPWGEIARQTGIKDAKNAVNGARQHALLHRLPWPVGSSPQVHQPSVKREDTVSAEVYRLRVQEGLTFPEIDRRLGMVATAYALARKYALTRGLPWPVESESIQVEETRQKGMEAYELREQGLTWAKVGAHMGLPEMGVMVRAQTHAKRFGLPWPIEYQSRGELAYRLRCQGLSWAAVTRKAEYSYLPHAVAGARRWATREEMPWPISWIEPVMPGAPLGERPVAREAYERRLHGEDWAQIIEELGFSESYLRVLATAYARKHDLMWPVGLFWVVSSDNTGGHRTRGPYFYKTASRVRKDGEWLVNACIPDGLPVGE